MLKAATPPVMTGIADLIPRYDLLLCDVWGVVHNGHTPYAEAVDALNRARAAGVAVVLISNAPRPGEVVARQMTAIGVPVCYDAVVASGDVTRDELVARPGVRVYHLGPERDMPNYEGLDVKLVDLPSAELVVCTGLFDDTRETPDDYAGSLADMHRSNLLMLCANPDIVVGRGDERVWCAGALARDYERIGGKVIYAGKPYAPIYETAARRARNVRGGDVAPDRVLAIGDGVRTDLAGAARQGYDCLFVAGGIHAAELGLAPGGHPDPAKFSEVFAEAGAWPLAVIRQLAW